MADVQDIMNRNEIAGIHMHIGEFREIGRLLQDGSAHDGGGLEDGTKISPRDIYSTWGADSLNLWR
jgi:hypothetical protein